MAKIKALYHFLDKVACRNRMQGDVFDVSEKRADELVKAGLVALVEPKPKTDTKPAKEPEPLNPPADPPKKQAKTKKDLKE